MYVNSNKLEGATLDTAVHALKSAPMGLVNLETASQKQNLQV